MVSSSLSSKEGSGVEPTPFIHTYTQTFEKMFPYYLSIGMTETQYWDGDATLVKAYRKAEEITVEKQNFQMWLQGRYFYDALCAVSPIFHAFAKKGTKPQPYRDEPYPITQANIEKTKEKKEKSEYNKNKVFMETFMAKNNKAFKTLEKGGEL